MKEASPHKAHQISRRRFIRTALGGTVAILAGCKTYPPPISAPLAGAAGSASERPVVSIVKIQGGNIEAAVEAAIDLLGGIETVLQGKERIMLKPNLVSNDSRATTDPQVIRSLAKLMKGAGKAVSIGEGSAVASACHTRRHQLRLQLLLTLLQQILRGPQVRAISPPAYVPCYRCHRYVVVYGLR